MDERKQKRKRDVHRCFSFELDDSQVTVCKLLVLKTLDIGESYFDNAMKNRSRGVYSGSDKRGKNVSHK